MHSAPDDARAPGGDRAPDEARARDEAHGRAARDGARVPDDARGEARRVRLVRGGPVLVEGPVTVVGDDGVPVTSDRFMVALCTCRRSRRYPWCDTSHRRRTAPRDTPHDGDTPRDRDTGRGSGPGACQDDEEKEGPR